MNTPIPSGRKENDIALFLLDKMVCAELTFTLNAGPDSNSLNKCHKKASINCDLKDCKLTREIQRDPNPHRPE